MSEPFPSKSITIGGHTFQLHGIAADDPYWTTLYEEFEPDFQRFCQRLVQPDYVCLDVGANIGIKTLYLSRHCPQGQVVAVEAGKSVAECLATNIAANEAHNAVSVHAAAAGHNGMVRFDEASAWGHVGLTGVDVEALTLEELVSRRQLERVDFIKIDVEGFELPVLRSSLDLINRFESLVFVEFNSLTLLVWGNTSPREFIEWVTSNFRHVFVLNRAKPDGEMLTPVVSTDQCGAIIHRNLIDDGCVSDLVMSNAAHRFKPSAASLNQRLSESLTSLSDARAGLTTAQADLLAARDGLTTTTEKLTVLDDRRTQLEAQNAELTTTLSQISARLQEITEERDALLASTSWRVLAPLRWIGRRVRRNGEWNWR